MMYAPVLPSHLNMLPFVFGDSASFSGSELFRGSLSISAALGVLWSANMAGIG